MAVGLQGCRTNCYDCGGNDWLISQSLFNVDKLGFRHLVI